MKPIEFMNKNDGQVVVFEEDNTYVLSPEHTELIDFLYGEIARRYTLAFDALTFIYAKSRPNYRYHRFLIVNRFVRCNFGAYDTREMDIASADKWSFEKVECPLRGECPHEGVICNPKLQTGLSERELEIVALSAEGYTAKDIAGRLSISIHTVNVHISHILTKLDTHSVKYIISWYHANKNAIK